MSLVQLKCNLMPVGGTCSCKFLYFVQAIENANQIMTLMGKFMCTLCECHLREIYLDAYADAGVYVHS